MGYLFILNQSTMKKQENIANWTLQSKIDQIWILRPTSYSYKQTCASYWSTACGQSILLLNLKASKENLPLESRNGLNIINTFDLDAHNDRWNIMGPYTLSIYILSCWNYAGQRHINFRDVSCTRFRLHIDLTSQLLVQICRKYPPSAPWQNNFEELRE